MIALRESKQQEIKDQKESCGAWATFCQCSKHAEHINGKKIFCGREWCPVCGKNNSAVHKRRIARVLPKVMQIEKMGYFVIEFPNRIRKIGAHGLRPDSPADNFWCYSKKDLRSTTDIIVNTLAGKRTSKKRRTGGYFDRGLLRWHWFGDKIPGKYNPHVNILVDSQFIKKEKLELIKTDLREALNVSDLIVNYTYCDSPAEKYHEVEYITRSTFLKKNWDYYMAHELFNFRNQRWWGKWDKDPVWSVNKQGLENDISMILKAEKLRIGLCPVCDDGTKLKMLYRGNNHKPIYWTRPVDSAWLIIMGAKEYAGTGYYELSNIDRQYIDSLSDYGIINESGYNANKIKKRGE